MWYYRVGGDPDAGACCKWEAHKYYPNCFRWFKGTKFKPKGAPDRDIEVTCDWFPNEIVRSSAVLSKFPGQQYVGLHLCTPKKTGDSSTPSSPYHPITPEKIGGIIAPTSDQGETNDSVLEIDQPDGFEDMAMGSSSSSSSVNIGNSDVLVGQSAGSSNAGRETDPSAAVASPLVVEEESVIEHGEGKNAAHGEEMVRDQIV